MEPIRYGLLRRGLDWELALVDEISERFMAAESLMGQILFEEGA